MTRAEKIRRLAAAQMERAGEAMRAGRTLLEAELYNDSVSRSYYAMFHAASALLLTRGLSTSKHKGMLSLFDLHFVKGGLVTAEMSKWLHAAFQARQEADYGDTAANRRSTAEVTLHHAEDFFGRIRPILGRLLAELDRSPPAGS